MTFEELLHVTRKKALKEPLKILALDPGETTGVCTLELALDKVSLKNTGQLDTKTVPVGATNIARLIAITQPTVLIVEDYKVYGWKSDSHAWAELHTPKLIGAIEYIAYTINLPMTKQSAQVGKAFCTDEKLKEWGFYQVGYKHANDAIRHACQAMLFSKFLG